MSTKNLKTKLLDEIFKSGYPLELRVSRLLDSDGYYVANNLYYIAHKTKETLYF